MANTQKSNQPSFGPVLWLVSITLPSAAVACGIDGCKEIGGGWLTGQLTALKARASITVCSVDSRTCACRSASADGVQYRLLAQDTTEAFTALLKKEKPALVHIWGTEYEAARHMHQAATALGVPVLVSMQGVMADCATHLLDGVPQPLRRSCFAQRLIDKAVPGGLLDLQQARFDALAQSEATLLADARYVTGRTAFDREACQRLAPHATYFRCGETLRPEFYPSSGKALPWQPHDYGTAPVLFMGSGSYPLKNLHTVLKAMPKILSRWPGACLMVAGWPPLDKGPLLRPVIDWMFPYQSWCAELVQSLGLQAHVRYTGPLNTAAMMDAYLGADVFLLPSYSENSPNSLGEAMLLGVPCVASRAGGIPSMAQDGTEAVLYGEPGDETALADALTKLLENPQQAAEMGHAARRRAAESYNANANAEAMLGIYKAIAQNNSANS